MYPQRHLLETLRQIGCSQSAFSGIVGVNAGDLSRFLRGAPNFSATRVEQIRQGLADVVQLSQESGLPLDFRQIGAIREAIARMHARESGPKVQPEKTTNSNAAIAAATLTAWR
jgi:hypothetical protein